MTHSYNDSTWARWRQAATVYADIRLWRIFGLGIASGFPWVMIGSAMSAWLTEEGLSRTDIGFFGLVFVAYSVNFLWSPLVDRMRLPIVGRLFGQRRSWILLMQGLVALCCFAISTIDPSSQFRDAQVIALLLAFVAATQDIAIDAFRIDSFASDTAADSRLVSAASAMATSGWWTGFAGLGALPFVLVDLDAWEWADMYQLMALMMLVLMLVPLFAREPQTQRDALHAEKTLEIMQRLQQTRFSSGRSQRVLAWLWVSFVEPMAEFFRRNGVGFALSILLFIFLFKIGESFLGRMSIVFYKEIGFSNTDIALYSKLVSWWVTIAFSLLGSLINIRYGILRGLFIGGIAMSASNLMFAALALAGPDKSMLLLAVLVDGFTSAWATVAFVAFLSILCNQAFTASQYALLASIGTLGRTFLASYSGLVVDSLAGNWVVFFLLTTFMVVPSLILLNWMRHRLRDLSDSI